MGHRTLFVTVGSTLFDDLINHVCSRQFLFAVKEQCGVEMVVIQYGKGNNVPDPKLFEDVGMELESYRYKPSIEADFDRADLVISHAGSGSILEALRKKKKTIVAVNTNLMDNHQLELAQKLAEEGYLDYCLPEHIEQAVERASDREFKEFPKQDSSLFAHELCAHLAAIECNR